MNPNKEEEPQCASGRLTQVSFSGGNFSYYYDYNQAGRVTANQFTANNGSGVSLQATYAWDTQGRMTNMTYPSGASLNYAYDSMSRLSQISSSNYPNYYGASATATYNAESQLSTLSYGGYGVNFTETRTYNSLMQLATLTNTGVNMQYNYTAGHNNGRVAQTVDSVLGETVNYTYDMWNRLTNATATNGNWGEQYTFDNFGNLTGKTPTAGSAPAMSGGATNQTSGTSGYDANGNPLGYSNGGGPGYLWDVENHLATDQTAAYTPIVYTYDPWGRRVWKQIGSGRDNYGNIQPYTGEVYFYGATGQKLETYSFTWESSFGSSLEGINMYFGGKLLQSKGVWVATDKLGSVRANSNGESMSYWPYGEERDSTANGREKFATYTRDGVGQDYAMARYYNSSTGAFWTPDPGGIKTAKPSNPTSWNRYAYTNGDPINFGDPSGKIVVSCSDPDATSIYDGSCDGDGGDDGDGGGNNCGGNELDAAPDPSCYADVPLPYEPADPSCTLTFEYRALSGNPYLYVGSLGYAAHAYLDFTASDGTSVIAEGTGHKGNVVAQETDSGLPNDHPSSDHVAGSITSPDVCDWLSIITQAATTINNDNVPYHWYGPNSSTVLYYILSQLPSTSWWSTPPGLLGFRQYPF